MKARFIVFLAFFSLLLAGCHQEGPAERAGKKLDNVGQSVTDTLNPPQGPAQAVGRKVDRALGSCMLPEQTALVVAATACVTFADRRPVSRSNLKSLAASVRGLPRRGEIRERVV